MSGLARTLLTARGFHVGLGGFLLILYVLRIALFPGASEDDAEQLFYAQSLAGGYKSGQPPLYTWLVYLALQISAIALPVVVALKFAALAAIYGLSYRIARLAHCSEGWSAFSGLSVFAMYYIGWDSVLNYSQTVLMAALCLAVIHAVLRIVNDHTRWVDFVYLGVIAGTGVMTKYNFAILLVALLGAAMMDAELRRKLLGIKGLVAVLLAGLIVLPHGLWLLAGHIGSKDLSNAVTQTSAVGLAAGAQGVVEMLRAAVSILSPLLILFVVFFPKAFLPIKQSLSDRQSAHLLLMRGGLFVFVIMGLMIIASGITSVRNHWLIVLIGFPVLATLRISTVYPDLDSKRVRWFVSVLVVLGGVVASVLVGKAVQGADGCRKCRLIVSFSELADQVRVAGFERGTILTYDFPTQVAGNLRRYFPDSRFLSTRFKTYEGPALSLRTGQCLAVWHLDSSQSTTLQGMTGALKSRLGVDVQENDQMQIAEVPLGGGQTMRFGYVLINDPARQGNCR